MKVLYILPVVSSLFVTSASASKIRTMGTINNEAKSILKTEEKETKELTSTLFYTFDDTKTKVINGIRVSVSKVMPSPVFRNIQKRIVRKTKLATNKKVISELIIDSHIDLLIDNPLVIKAFKEWYKYKYGEKFLNKSKVKLKTISNPSKEMTLENNIITFEIVFDGISREYSFNIKRK